MRWCTSSAGILCVGVLLLGLLCPPMADAADRNNSVSLSAAQVGPALHNLAASDTEIEAPRADDLRDGLAELPANFSVQGSKFPQPGGLGTRVDVTYSFSNLFDGAMGLPNPDMKVAVEEALTLWARYAPLHFTEMEDSGPAVSDTQYPAANHPDIRFGHHAISDDNGTNILAHAFSPTGSGLSGDVHFDDQETWRLDPADPGFDVLYTAVHELGHPLGLNHEPLPSAGGNKAIMNAFIDNKAYSGLGSAFLYPDDIAGVRAIYGEGTGGVAPLSVPEPATFLLAILGAMGVLTAAARRRG